MAKLSPALRDALVLVAVFAVLLGGLYAYTGTWPPAVIVESGSMMHKECGAGEVAPACDPSIHYGRFGTIDPGDLVLVKKVSSIDDVQTQVEGGPSRYGKPGDVIVYFPANNHDRTPIIHRAVAYVDVAGSGTNTTYRVRWNPDAPCVGGATKDPADAKWCVYDNKGV